MLLERVESQTPNLDLLKANCDNAKIDFMSLRKV